jgi:ElaB/YqjD/DUF883 family membrane-anchored ribosome-binding protein
MPRMNEEKPEETGSATEHIKEHAAGIGREVRNLGGELGGMAREKFQDFRDQAQDYYQRGRQKASELEGSFENYIQEQPIKSILIAAGVGLLVGMFWRRR